MSSCSTDTAQGPGFNGDLLSVTVVTPVESPAQVERDLDSTVGMGGTLRKMAQQSCLQDIVLD